MNRMYRVGLAGAALLAGATVLASCDRGTKYDTNLLENASFEEIGGDGLPKGWKLELFRGSPESPEVVWGVDTLAVDGKRSFYFRADPGTRRFYYLQQEVKVTGATQVRVKGWILGYDVKMRPEQSAQCNFLVTYYDKDHNRFSLERPADRRTPVRRGTYPWEEQVYMFDVPEGTHYIAFSCLLGMNGQAWFDNVALEIPKPYPWETETTKNYVFHWMPGHPLPPNAPREQQARFDYIADQLGVQSDIVINYYFYPDTTAIQQMTGIKGIMYTSWDDYEFHTIEPGDDHEVVHFITDSIGRPPKSIAEGTVVWLHDGWGGRTLDEWITDTVRANKVTKLTDLFEYNDFIRTDPQHSMTTAAAFIKFSVEKFGEGSLMDLYRAINGMNSYAPIASASETVYKQPMQKTEQEFHKWLLANYK